MDVFAALPPTCIVVVTLLLPSSGLAQTNQRIGTWELNVAESTFSPGPAFSRESQVAGMVGDSIKVTNEITDAAGRTVVLG
jgi:hypothetical protein